MLFVKVHKFGKNPVGMGWQHQTFGDPELMSPMCLLGYNVGVMLGADSGVIDIECDSPDAEMEFLETFGNIKTVSWRGRRGLHRLFKYRDGFPAKAKIMAGAIEVRIGGGDKGAQSVIPPSVVHDDRYTDDHHYTWVNDLKTPLAEITNDQLELLITAYRFSSSYETSQVARQILRLKKPKSLFQKDFTKNNWGDKYKGDLKTLDLEKLLDDRLIGHAGEGKLKITCPWKEKHNSGDDSAYVFKTESGYPYFYCHHSHGQVECGTEVLLNLYPNDRVDECCDDLYFDATAQSKIIGLPHIEDVYDFVRKPICEPTILIDNILHKGSKMLLGGGSKGFKTWTLFNMAFCISYGIPWMGHETEKNRVLYVNFEIPDYFAKQRLLKLAEYLDIEQTPGNFDLWNLRGYSAPYEIIFPLISKYVQEREGEYGAIFLDPLYKLFGDADENSAGDITKLCNEMECIIKDTGAACISANHFSKGNQSFKDAIDRISGSGVWGRDPDTILTFTAHEEKDCYTVNSIVRNFPPTAEFVVKWLYPSLCLMSELDPNALKKRYSFEEKYSDEDILLPIREQKVITTNSWIEAVGMSESAFYKRRYKLVNHGLVEKIKGTNNWRFIGDL
jgi:hypothetical protein